MKERECKLDYNENDVILGLIVFLTAAENVGKKKAIIQRTDTVLDFDSPEQAHEFGCGAVDAGYHDSFLVPSLYDGEVVVLE